MVSDLTFALLEPEAVAVHLEDMDMVGEAIEQRAGQPLGAEHAGPLIEGQVAGDDDRTAPAEGKANRAGQLLVKHRVTI